MKKFYFIFAIALVCVAVVGTAYSQQLTLNSKEIASLKKLLESDKSAAKQFAQIQTAADESVKDAPNPIATVSTEGRLKGDPIKTATADSLLDVRKMYSMAIVYRLKGGDAYLNKTVEFLKAWAATNHPTGDPIDETNYDGFFEAYDLLNDKISASDKQSIENWFRAVAQAEINSPRMAKGRQTAMNNWNSHRLKIVGEVAWVLNDEKLKKWVIDGLQTQISVNLNPDGTSWDFLERDALHYHCYDLEPLTKLAIIIKRNGGADYFHYESEKKASIAKSFDFLAPFISGEKTHPEFVNTKVAFDKARAANNEKGYVSGTLFNVPEGYNAMILGGWFEPKLLDIVRKARNDGQKYPSWQAVLNEATK